MAKTIIVIIIIAIVAGLAAFMFWGLSLTQKNQDAAISVPAEGNIVITSPASGENITTGNLVVRGRAKVSENQFRVRLKGGGRIIYDDSVTANAADAGQYGDFEVTIPISAADITGTSILVLEAFDNSPKDGKEIDRVAVPLNIEL